MKISFNIVSQVLMLVVQMLNISTPIVEDKYKPYMAIAIGFLQGIIAIIAHNFNPDGTSDKVAYIPKEKV